MTCQIIQFDKYGELPRGKLYRQQAVPRGLPGQPAHARGKARRLERQVARISDLLKELEELARTADDVPAAVLREARVGIDRARAILRPLQTPEGKADDIEGDPQPRLNHEELERMYRSIHPET